MTTKRKPRYGAFKIDEVALILNKPVKEIAIIALRERIKNSVRTPFTTAQINDLWVFFYGHGLQIRQLSRSGKNVNMILR